MPRNPEESRRPGVALVIGSGGVKCAAAIGLWKVLQREGIPISVAVGCSGGSIYAALIALGQDIATIEQMTLGFWTGEILKGYTTNLREVQSGAQRFTERSGLVDDGPLMAALEQAFGERTFAEARVPLHLVAANFYNGERIVLAQGRIRDAVRASIAIPTIFPPWEIDGQLLVDGAAADPLPVDVAIKEGGQIILAMGFEMDYRTRMASFTAVNAQLNNIYINNLLRASYAFHNLAHHDEIIPMLPRFDRAIGSFDTAQIPYIIEQGAKTAEAQIPYLRRLLAG